MGAKTGGWIGKTLRVDLSAGRCWTEDSLALSQSYIGGRGVAARIAWDEIAPGTGAYDPENRLIIGAGPLTGTSAPNTSRTTVCSLSPQSYPWEWFSYSSFGGYWGPMLKYAGFDTIVVQGASDTPVYLWIHDGRAELRDASALWGQGIYATQRAILGEVGANARVLAIGQAGENLVRIATIACGSSGTAGQGGFGAVMGSKKLKAIAVHGTGSIPIAEPEAFGDCTLAIRRAAEAPCGCPRGIRLDKDLTARYGQRFSACTQGCSYPRCFITRAYKGVPGVVHTDKAYTGHQVCVSGLFSGAPDLIYDWKIGFQAGFELSQESEDWGLNHWELTIGMIPWLRHCQQAGLLHELDGQPLDWDSPAFWDTLLHKIAFREGIGDVLAEGGVRAAHALGMGVDLLPEHYAAWGYSGHWDGRGDHANLVVYPYWLVTALQWAMATRDPMSSGHGYAQNIMMWSPMRSPEEGLDWEQLADVGARVYGSRDAVHPLGGYKDKAYPAFFHGQRSVLKDSLTADDQTYPRIYSKRTPDHLARAGDMLGPEFEYHMFRHATGMELSEPEFQGLAERVFNVERALQVRNWGRSRQVDETVIPYFQQRENVANPLVGERMGLDRAQFGKLLDEYYSLRGWDPASGRPTRARLEALGLSDVADGLAAAGLLPEGA